MTKVLAWAAWLRKGLAALVALVVSAGGISVFLPDLPAPWASLAAGAFTLLTAVLAPANGPKPGAQTPSDGPSNMAG